jgi:hypothetical protein
MARSIGLSEEEGVPGGVKTAISPEAGRESEKSGLSEEDEGELE